MTDATFWDRTAEKYFKQPIADPEAYAEKLRLTRSYLSQKMEALEFGCGTGGTALELAPHVKHLRAIDVSPKMIDIANGQLAETTVDNVTFECRDIADFDDAPESFDAVFGMSILHLVRARAEIIGKIHRLMKPGGVFASSTACIADTMPWFRLIAPIGRVFGAFPYVEIFTADQLVKELMDAGFVIEEQWRPKDGKAIAVFIVARKPA